MDLRSRHPSNQYEQNACKACSGNVYIFVTVELTDEDPTLTLHEHFLAFNLTYMNIMNYYLMCTLNTTLLMPSQLEIFHINYPIILWQTMIH